MTLWLPNVAFQASVARMSDPGVPPAWPVLFRPQREPNKGSLGTKSVVTW